MSLKNLFAKLRMKKLFLQTELEANLQVLHKKGLKTAWRHARLRRKVYFPWLRQKIMESGIFDRDFYVSRYVKGDIVVDPFEHYLRRGIYHGLSPNAEFNPVWWRLKMMPSRSRYFPALDYALKREAPPTNQAKFHTFERDWFSPRFRQLLLLCQMEGIDVSHDMVKILDFGCGEGAFAAELRQNGFDAYGYDIVKRLSPAAEKYGDFFSFNTQSVDTGAAHPYVSNYQLKKEAVRLPWPDNMFDIIVSYQTLEHVFNIEETHSEIARILKPGGIAFHIYIPKSCFMERHTNIPLGHRLHYKWYFQLWALLGMCGNHRKKYSRMERGRLGYEYVQTATNYTRNEDMLKMAARYFPDVSILPWPEMFLNPARNAWRKLFLENVLLICRKRIKR